MALPFHGYGSLLKVAAAAGSPETWQTIAGLFSIKPGKMSTAPIDVTVHESPSAHRERIAGIRDTDALTATGNYMPGDTTQNNDNANGLAALWRSRAIRSFKIVCSDADGSELPLRGFVSGLDIGEMGLDDKVPFTLEITTVEEGTLP